MKVERLECLARLPLLLNSSLDPRVVITTALKHLCRLLPAEAGTVYQYQSGASEINFWAVSGSEGQKLVGRKIPKGAGIAGWCIDNRQSVVSNDIENDARFFNQVDQQTSFKTRSVICVPLVDQSGLCSGALQLINALDGRFSEDDLVFVERAGAQLALALENARLHELVLERSKRLEQLDRRKTEILSLLAHELRTPLNIIVSSSEIIRHDPIGKESETLRSFCETLDRGVRRMLRVVAQLGEVRQIAEEPIALQRSVVDVAGVFTDLQRYFGPIAEKRGQKLTFEFQQGVAVDGDRGMLCVALRNLIANAIRFTPDGGSIKVRAQPAMGMVEFAVDDTGIGIAREQHGAIFEKFFEVVPLMEHSSGEYEFMSAGLGLGLPAAQAVAGAHGTTIKVSSEVDKGSSFSFALPLSKA